MRNVSNRLKRLLATRLGGSGNEPLKQNTLVRWRKEPNIENFGDKLSDVVVQSMLHRSGYFLDDVVLQPKRLLAIGSILHFAENRDVIWGSGVNGKVNSNFQNVRLDVRAVR